MTTRSNLEIAQSVLTKLSGGSAPLYLVGDHVRASHLGSKILEPAVATAEVAQ